MQKINVGIALYEDDDTAKIYELFSDYFELVEDECFTKYILNNEPSVKLVEVLKKYFGNIDEKNRKRSEFCKKVAYEVFSELSKNEKQYIFEHPNSTEHHFGLGLMIRNKFVYNNEIDYDAYDTDTLSSEILGRIAELLINNYDYDNFYYQMLYDDFVFCHLRKMYFLIIGEYPDSIIDKYNNEVNKTKAVEKCIVEIKNAIINEVRYFKLCDEYNLSKKKYLMFKEFIDNYNKTNWEVIPYDVALVACSKMEAEVRKIWLGVLNEVLVRTPRMAMELPTFIFNQKDTVLLAVSVFGKSLKRFKRFNKDNDVIRSALYNDGEAIQYVSSELRDNPKWVRLALKNDYSNSLKMPCMVKYRDDEKWVNIALEANGCNIKYVSKRLKDDFNMAKVAITHQKIYYPESTFCNLSARLKDNLELAILDIEKGHACIDSYSRRLRNSDIIAEKLLASEHKWKLYLMSQRIQESYRVDE